MGDTSRIEPGSIVRCRVTGSLETGSKYAAELSGGHRVVVWTSGLAIIGQESDFVACDGELYAFDEELERTVAAINTIRRKNDLEEIDLAHYAKESAESNRNKRRAFLEIREKLATEQLKDCWGFVVERLAQGLNLDGLTEPNMHREDYILKHLLMEYGPEKVTAYILGICDVDAEKPESPVGDSLFRATQKAIELFPGK